MDWTEFGAAEGFKFILSLIKVESAFIMWTYLKWMRPNELLKRAFAFPMPLVPFTCRATLDLRCAQAGQRLDLTIIASINFHPKSINSLCGFCPFSVIFVWLLLILPHIINGWIVLFCRQTIVKMKRFVFCFSLSRNACVYFDHENAIHITYDSPSFESVCLPSL